MHTHSPIHIWKRWLPALVLLMVLAQLASSAHWHWGEHSAADCGLFSQQTHTDDAINANTLMVGPKTLPIKIAAVLPAFLRLDTTRSISIRAPPPLS